MNAFGDATMALAFFILIAHTNSLSFAALDVHLSSTQANLVALGLLGGAVAKSAQIPLQTWLPDAMEGPTPVSALIHAATMVTAGVYLIARTHPIFEQARTVELIAAGTGALTLLVAGLIALVQTDIKRVIAYSTMSQIGYMFVGVGVGGYANGMFHLMTHAFFKALLFMTAGLAIHALADEQDIRKMRGLGKVMPFTKWCFLAGALALVGIPPFAGFFSKDPIIASTLNIGWYGYVFYACGIAGAFLTGLYTFRLWFLVFPGEPSPFVREHYHDHHGREGAWTMLVPVGILAVLATVGGWIQFPPHWDPITKWLAPVAPSTRGRRGELDAGDRHLDRHRPRRPRGHRRRVGGLLRAEDRDSRRPVLAAGAREQVLLRLALRADLLRPRRRDRELSCGASSRSPSCSRPAPTSATRRSPPVASCAGSRPACSAPTSSSSPPAPRRSSSPS